MDPFFCWRRGSTRSPTSSPAITSGAVLGEAPTPIPPVEPSNQPPTSTQPPPSTQPSNGSSSSTTSNVCPMPDCNQSRIHLNCWRRTCKKHCLSAGGCGIYIGTGGKAQPLPSSTAPGPPPSIAAQDLHSATVSPAEIMAPPSTLAQTLDSCPTCLPSLLNNTDTNRNYRRRLGASKLRDRNMLKCRSKVWWFIPGIP